MGVEMNTRWSVTHVELIPFKFGLGGHEEGVGMVDDWIKKHYFRYEKRCISL